MMKKLAMCLIVLSCITTCIEAIAETPLAWRMYLCKIKYSDSDTIYDLNIRATSVEDAIRRAIERGASRGENYHVLECK